MTLALQIAQRFQARKDSKLAPSEEKGSFATRSNCPSDDLCLEVGGVGPIRFPVSAASARKLCKVARPAAYPVAAFGELLQGCRPKGRYHKALEALSLDPPRLGLDRLYDHVVFRWPLAKQRRRFTAT